MTRNAAAGGPSSPPGQRFLDGIEWLGNRLPDPVFIFLLALLLTWVLSSFMAPIGFSLLDPRTQEPIRVVNQLAATSLVQFISNLVGTFVAFPPLGQVLVALLGVGVADHSGFVQTAVRGMLQLTPRRLLTPMVLLVSVLSHSIGDSAYVLIIPLAGLAYAAAGRHPLLGIATSFAGLSGAFSASLLPSSLDPLLQGFTQKAAQIIDPGRVVNPLCNWGFNSASSVAIIAVGWFVADRIVEPRLHRVPIDGEPHPLASAEGLRRRELCALLAGLAVMAACLIALAVFARPAASPLRSSQGNLVASDAPLMQSIVPLVFLLFLLPGVTYGFVAGTFKSHRDIVEGMTKAMGTVNYYLVMAFFAAQFTAAFTHSNLGLLLAVKGARTLIALELPPQAAILALIAMTAAVNLLIGSASAKWALLSPIFVPMLMSVGLSPELTQAAYRIGDSSTNIITPLMPYFPLVVVFAQRHARSAGIGTLVSLMLPYSVAFLLTWSVGLMLFWAAGLPLGLQAGYNYIP
jgi:aminobenzoyl-glutamate transport protein